MSDIKMYRVAVIGCGAISVMHLDSIVAIDNLELVLPEEINELLICPLICYSLDKITQFISFHAMCSKNFYSVL